MIAVLFARHDSVYKSLPGLDVYDKERDALTFPGGMPVVAHPPCRSWSRMRAFAKPAPGEKELAVWAVRQVRRYGGVLEHPEASALWKEMRLPLGLERDLWGGYTLSVDQFWFGHRARKRTWLYIVGIDPNVLPQYPLRMDAIMHTVGTTKKRWRENFRPKPSLSPSERERTPPAFAEYLISIAKKTKLCQ